MNQASLIDMDGESVPLDPSKLSEQAKLLYDGYCKVLRLSSLPIYDMEQLENIAKEYFVHPLIDFFKTTLKVEKSSTKTAFKDGKIVDFSYFVPLIKTLNKSAIKKENYNERYKSLGGFLEVYADNNAYKLIRDFFNGNGRDITDLDVQELVKIIDTYSIYDIEFGIGRCIKDGHPVCNMLFLSKVMVEVKVESEREKIRWTRENWEEDVRVKAMKIEQVLNQKEIERTAPNPYEEEDKRIIQKLMSMRGNDDN